MANYYDSVKATCVDRTVTFNYADPIQAKADQYRLMLAKFSRKKIVAAGIVTIFEKNMNSDGTIDEEGLRRDIGSENHKRLWATEAEMRKEKMPKVNPQPPIDFRRLRGTLNVEDVEIIDNKAEATSTPTCNGLASMMTAPKKPKFELSKEDQGYVDMFPDDFNKQVLIKAIQEEPAGWGILKQYMQEFGVTKEDEIICIFKKDDKDCPIDNTVEFISAPDYEEKYEQYQKEGYIPSVVRYGGEFTPATGGWVCLPSMEGMAGENNPFEAFLSARYDYNPENTPSYQIRPNTQCQPRRVQEEVTLPILRLMLKYINPEYNRLIEARGGIKACGLQVRSIRGGGRLTLNDDFKVIEY